MSPVSSGHVVLIQVKVLIIHYLSIHVHPSRYVVSSPLTSGRVVAGQSMSRVPSSLSKLRVGSARVQPRRGTSRRVRSSRGLSRQGFHLFIV
jgi:hypothetical protein